MKIFGLLAVIFLLYVSSASAADTCGVCKNLATTVKTLLANNETSSQIKSQLLRICNFLGPYSAQCTSLVQQNFDTLVALVEKYDDPAVVCQKIGLCPQLVEAQVGGFDKCSVCHFLVGVGEGWIERNSTEQDIFKVLEGACKIIPGAYGAVCRQMIETFGPKIVQALLNRENPDTICKQIHLCTAALDEVDPVPVYSPADVKVKGAAECYVCKLVIGYIENFVKANSTEQEIIKEAEKVCSILPSSIKSICNNIVSNYVPQVINLLLQKVPPASICAHLKLCTSSVALNDALTVAEAQRVGSTKYCQICQYVVTSAENFLGSQSTESEIAALAGKICAILPSKFSSVCQQFVSNGLPLAMKYILAKETPQVACAQIKLCSSAKTDFVKMSIQQ